MQKTALICGVSGQDGAYLAQLLLSKGYKVFGTSRDEQTSSFSNLHTLGIRDQVETCSVALNDFRSILHALTKTEPDEIYNLAGQTSVGLSFEMPMETFESNMQATLNILEAIRFTQRPIRFFNPASSECFGNTNGIPATENTPFNPRSPYAVAKAAAYWQTANYREAYGLHACSGILFNHESPLRPKRFVTQKIVAAAIEISQGKREGLELGNISIERDWGWAPEYVEAMHAILQQDQADDYIIATGKSHTLEAFLEAIFASLDLDWKKYVTQNPRFFRPSDLESSRADPSKLANIVGWNAKFDMKDVAKMMVQHAQK
tara:strand:- start:83 stop:1039 length:957 start_codon:yes stop_codon:yes gene_type:complete